MRGVEAFLETLPPDTDVGYDDLAQVVYGVDHPTRAQLSAIGRAVGRLVEQGKAEREDDYTMGPNWEKPVPVKPYRSKWDRPPVRRGPRIRRETLVWWLRSD
jgi:hypothetical protein